MGSSIVDIIQWMSLGWQVIGLYNMTSICSVEVTQT